MLQSWAQLDKSSFLLPISHSKYENAQQAAALESQKTCITPHMEIVTA